MDSLIAVLLGLLCLVTGFFLIWLIGKGFETMAFDNPSEDPVMTVLHGLSGLVMLAGIGGISWKIGTLVLQAVQVSFS